MDGEGTVQLSLQVSKRHYLTVQALSQAPEENSTNPAIGKALYEKHSLLFGSGTGFNPGLCMY